MSQLKKIRWRLIILAIIFIIPGALLVISINTSQIKHADLVGRAYSPDQCAQFLRSWQCKDAESQGLYCDWDYRRTPSCFQTISRPQPYSGTVSASSGSCELIHKGGNGDSSKNLDIVWVGDKFPDINSYKKITNSIKYNLLFRKSLFPGSPNSNLFNSYKNRINIWRVNTLSSLNCRDNQKDISCDKDKVKNAASVCRNTDVIGAYEFKDSRFAGYTPREGFINGYFKSLIFGADPFSFFVVDRTDLREFDSIYYADTAHNKSRLNINNLWEGDFELGGKAAQVTSHELGHVIGQLPDYYKLYSNFECTNHPSVMCNASRWDYGNKKLSLDRVRMVQTMNQFCNAEVSPVRFGYAYPNPFNPARDHTQNIRYKVSFPYGGQSCYIMMHVYNARGQEVRALVTDKPMPRGEYIFKWDGKNNNLENVASGAYFYRITGGKKLNGSWSRVKAKGILLK